MTPLLTARSLSKAYGARTLFEAITFTICTGDRIGIIGPNGAGKSSLLKILANLDESDSGEITRKAHSRTQYVSQAPQFPEMSIEAFLIAERPDLADLDSRTRAHILLSQAEFKDFEAVASKLSGGWKKRLDIARALMHEPDLILFDEPTNHLDLEGILWLEKLLERLTIPFMVISHDRYFLENVTNKTMEVNKCYPEGMLMRDGPLSTFMEKRDAFMEAQAKKARELGTKARRETAWLKTGAKARTTKSRSRIQEAYKVIDELDDLKARRKTESAAIDFSASERKTQRLLTAQGLTKSLGERELFKNIDLTMTPGMRLGIVGQNGTGKTTLLRVLAGELKADSGTIKYADDMRLVYFDQHRAKIPENVTLKEALAEGGDTVNFRGRDIHVVGWAKRFLFTSDRLGQQVSTLSGGERARILIAKLILEPADILFLDEPTNDLDIETLEVIEESLMSFKGAVVLISHDRCMMDRLCTHIVGLGENLEDQLFADYAQWEAAVKKSACPQKKETKTVRKRPRTERKKLSYKDQRELDMMEDTVAKAEAHLAQCEAQSDYETMGKAHKEIERLYTRWQELIDLEGSSHED